MSFQKIIQGTFNQSHSMFGESAGKQCACCSLYAISFTVAKSPGNWNSNDIDYIIKEGDVLYKSLNKNTYLMVLDLPNIFPLIDNIQVKVIYLENEYGFLNYDTSPPHFLSSSNVTNGDELHFFMKGFCISIIYKKNCLYLMDSHSRNNLGQPTPEGFSVLMRFKNRYIYIYTLMKMTKIFNTKYNM